MLIAKEYKLKNNTLKVVIDENPEHPREEDQNITQMIFFGRKHRHLGDKHEVELNDSFESREDFIERGAEMIKKQLKDVVLIKPVHLYEHSGTAISTSMEYPFNDRWDSGTVGFVVITKKNLKKQFAPKVVKEMIANPESLDKMLEAEVELLNQYIGGEVYGFILEDKEGNHIDSTYGFYGDSNPMENGMNEYLPENIVTELKTVTA